VRPGVCGRVSGGNLLRIYTSFTKKKVLDSPNDKQATDEAPPTLSDI